MITTSIDRGVSVIQKHLKTLDDSAGVYRMLDDDNTVLYIGKAKRLKRRVFCYTQVDKLPLRLQQMVAQTVDMVFITTHTEAEALLLESNLIKKLKPKYNILLRDDKMFPYIWLRDHHETEFPQILKHRGKREKKGKYYGPFGDAYAVNNTINTIQKIFKLRSCSDSVLQNRSRPCLEYQIKRCTAPCVGHVDKHKYAKQVKEAKLFLDGKTSILQQQLAIKMQQASEAQEYEKAMIYRDRIQAITNIQARQNINLSTNEDADVIAVTKQGGFSCVQMFFFRNGKHYGNYATYPKISLEASEEEIMLAFIGQFYAKTLCPPLLIVNQDLGEDKDILSEALTSKSNYKVNIVLPKLGEKSKLIAHALDNAKQALARYQANYSSYITNMRHLQALFDLREQPTRIEVYDNSHIQGSYAIGAMIVVTAHGFDKGSYRTFNIKNNITAGDDYAMMREVLSRRLKRLASSSADNRPDLLLIDGGKGQLSAAVDTLKEQGLYEEIPVVAISKGIDRHAGREYFHLPDKKIMQLPPQHPALYFLQNIRDEAHRFAINTHRKKRNKKTLSSTLNDITGIGAKRKRDLLAHFGSLENVKNAGIADLKLVSGISEALAKQIYNFFR